MRNATTCTCMKARKLDRRIRPILGIWGHHDDYSPLWYAAFSQYRRSSFTTSPIFPKRLRLCDASADSRAEASKGGIFVIF